jgi:hypothetical protein
MPDAGHGSIPEMFNQALQVPVGLTVEELAWRLFLAFLLGCVAAGIYRATHRSAEPIPPNFIPTLILLSILIAMVTQVIGNNIARAFSLVGALSIVRFRTIIQDTRDTAFVIFAVVLGMAAGAGYLTMALLGTVIVGAASAVLYLASRRAAPPGAEEFSLMVRVPLSVNAEELVLSAAGKHLASHQILATGTARQGAALDITYRVRLRPGVSPAAVVLELNRVEGIQAAELRRLEP